MNVDTRAQQILKAKKEVELATAQETETGNPVVGAKHYFTAIELVMAAVQDLKHDTPESRNYFLYQVRQKLEDYFSRARLLLSVAEEEGLDLDLEDCMPFSGASRPSQPSQPPPMVPPGLPAPLGAPPVAQAPLPLGSIPASPPPSQWSHGTTGWDMFSAIQPLGVPRPSNAYAPQSTCAGAPPTPAAPLHKDPAAAAVSNDSDEPPTLGDIPMECFLFGVAPNKTAAAAPTAAATAAATTSNAHVASPSNAAAAEEESGTPGDDKGRPAASQHQGNLSSSSSSTRRMFAEDDSLRPGNPSFEELFRNFTSNCADEGTTAPDHARSQPGSQSPT